MRGSWAISVGVAAVLAGACAARPPETLVLRAPNASQSAGRRASEVRVVEVPSPAFPIVARSGTAADRPRPDQPVAEAVVVRVQRRGRASATGGTAPPPAAAPAPSGAVAAARSADRLPANTTAARPTCTTPYLRTLAHAYRDTAIGRKAERIADRYLRRRGIDPGSPAGRRIRPVLVGTALYDSGEIRYPDNPSAYGTGTHYARDLPRRPLVRRPLERALRDALRSPHHALHFREGLGAARRAGLLPRAVGRSK